MTYTKTHNLAAALAIFVGLQPALLSQAGAQTQAPTTTTGGWAVVDQDGTMTRNSNATSTTRVSAGKYNVTFNQDISRCAYTATLGGNGKKLTPGLIVVGRNAKTPQTVIVGTFTAMTLLPQDYKFDLNVSC